MFLENKYTHLYKAIITRSQTRVSKPQVVENHHIIPSSLGGSNIPENKVALTPREHFICHMLLTRMLEGKARQKMMWALHLMVFSNNPKQQRHRPTARVYDKFRTDFYGSLRGVPVHRTAEHQANINAANTKRLKGKTLPKEWRRKMSESRTGELNGMFGKKHSDEAKLAMSLKRIGKSTPPPPRVSCVFCQKDTTPGALTQFHKKCA